MRPWLPSLVLLFAPSCVSLTVSEETTRSLEAGELDACRVVFICHGMLKDLGADWDLELAEDLREDGILGIPVTYWTDPTGVWLNWGCVAPGACIARLADEITRLHEMHQPDRDLVIDCVGFSAGCEAILEALERVEGAKFRRLVFLHSSSFAFSFEVDRRIREGLVQDVVHFWSPIDGVTFFAPLGAGSFGLHHRADQIDNELRLAIHSARFIREGTRERVRGRLARRIGQPAPQLGAFARAVSQLIAREMAKEPPPE